MNCGIVYYSARKTSFCEKALKKSFADLGLNLSSAVFATKKEAFGDALMKSFEQSDAVFTVGGLEFEDSRSIRDIVSQAAAASHPTFCRKLKNEQGDDGFIIRAGKQLLVMLPDEPEQITDMMNGVLAAYIKQCLHEV